ncbi:MAG: transposase [Candidatus Berkelbacteria bacterium Licking1014_7]|uniref:Transposase n=1 Tax=Candidatus Berkelbacteria bacterium Licking1014_7 TaxID=2017147 RepID=A0A554LKT0_9BACT|nr:MAG: transposase [Candidatus Berkelbacteria bacterium Licking1014_7]
MPSRNVIKNYLDNSYYHIYNRGVEKRHIFLCQQDYVFFLSILKRLLTPQTEEDEMKSCFFEEIKLLVYCLMPNHFHLLIWQNQARSISQFMKILSDTYVNYFNQKYARVGSLCQGVYKAALIESDEQLLHTSRYIHTNPRHIGINPLYYPYSSLMNYTGERKQKWLDTKIILDYFDYKKRQTSLPTLYESFLRQKYHRSEILKSVKID